MTLTQHNERNRQTTTYPDNINYVVYEVIWALGIVMFCLFTAVALIRHF